jgi:hypothetical protein
MALLKRGEEGVRLKIELRRARQKEEDALREEVESKPVSPEEHAKRLQILQNCGISLSVKG